MKNLFTRLILAVMAISVLIAPATTSAIQIFDDVNENTTYLSSIEWAYDRGIIRGYGDGTFGPDNCVRRAELVKMIVEYQYPGQAQLNGTTDEPNFSDVLNTDWHYLYIKFAKNKGIISGYSDGTFRPGNCVNRAETMKIAVETLFPDQQLTDDNTLLYLDNNTVSDIPTAGWYVPYARFVLGNRLMGTAHTVPTAINSSGDFDSIKFFPGEDATRKEVAHMLLLMSGYTTGGNTGTTTGGTSGTTTGGGTAGTTTLPLGTPNLLTPANNSTPYITPNQTMGFTWSAADNASYYELMIRLADSTNYFHVQRADATSAIYQFNVVSGSQSYMWKVRAYGENGDFRESSENLLQFIPTPSIALSDPANEDEYPHGLNIPFQWTNSNLTPGGEFTVMMSCDNNDYPTSDRWLEWTISNDTATSYNLNPATDFNPSNTIGYGFNFDSNLYCHWQVFYIIPNSTTSIVRSEARNLVIKIDTL